MKLKEILLPTLVLFLVCGVVTGALSYTNALTKDTIEQQKQQQLQTAMEQLVPGGEYTSLDEQNTRYKATVKGETYYIFLTEGKGYKSDLQVMTAIDAAGTVTGVAVTDCANESPGIGQKVDDADFTAQFTGASGSVESVDAITGATYSSVAVQKAVNAALEQFESTVQGGSAQ